ncbi:MAG: hypothetical protein E7F29_31330, partial [Pseudomonas aeruginosa]|nr:hypothetical protein [Pseudomonas aeruginosa]
FLHESLEIVSTIIRWTLSLSLARANQTGCPDGYDPATSVRVLGLLRDICKEDGITAIVSLHQLEYARRFADRVVGLADSQIVFDAAPSELTDAQLERIYAGRSTTQPATAPAETPVMLAPSLEMSR